MIVLGLLKSYDKTKNIMTLFFSVMLMCRFVSVYWVMPHVVDGTIFFIISAGALFFIGSDFIKNKNILKTENIVLLILFFVSCVISRCWVIWNSAEPIPRPQSLLRSVNQPFVWSCPCTDIRKNYKTIIHSCAFCCTQSCANYLLSPNLRPPVPIWKKNCCII